MAARQMTEADPYARAFCAVAHRTQVTLMKAALQHGPRCAELATSLEPLLAVAAASFEVVKLLYFNCLAEKRFMHREDVDDLAVSRRSTELRQPHEGNCIAPILHRMLAAATHE